MNIKLKIFNNNINNKYKLIPFNTKLNDYRNKYEAPVSKEWKSTVYSYYKNSIKNISVNHLNLNKIVKYYFDFFFINKFIHYKNMSTKRRYSLLRRIHVSNIEIKQTNNKAIITLYIINTEKNRLYSRYIENLQSTVYKIILKSKMKYNLNKNEWIYDEYCKVTRNLKKYYQKILFKAIHPELHHRIPKFLKFFKLNFYLKKNNYLQFETKTKKGIQVKDLCLKDNKNTPLNLYKWFYLSYQTKFFFEKEIEENYTCSIPGFFDKKIAKIKKNIQILEETINNISTLVVSTKENIILDLTEERVPFSKIKSICLKLAVDARKLFKNIGRQARRDTYAYEFYYLKLNKTYFYLFKLNNFFAKILNKKIEFNIVSLKSLVFSTDIFTKALSLKLRKQKFFSIVKGMNSIINRAKLPEINTKIERANLKGHKDLNLINNKFKDTYLFSNKTNNLLLNHFLKEIQIKKINTLSKTGSTKQEVLKSIFNSIKHKNIGGIRLEVKGRLTRRYRADRAIYKLKWKGGLKNIESSFNKLSSVLYRGYLKPNLNYSVSSSKRRVGSFAVKGWMSGK